MPNHTFFFTVEGDITVAAESWPEAQRHVHEYLLHLLADESYPYIGTYPEVTVSDTFVTAAVTDLDVAGEAL